MYAVLYTSVFGLALCTAPALVAQSANAGKEDPDKPVQGGGALPTGWSARTDKEGPDSERQIRHDGAGLPPHAGSRHHPLPAERQRQGARFTRWPGSIRRRS